VVAVVVGEHDPHDGVAVETDPGQGLGDDRAAAGRSGVDEGGNFV
jgi:hypothetical protein